MILVLGIKRMTNKKEKGFLKFGDGEIHLKTTPKRLALVGSLFLAFSGAAFVGEAYVEGRITDEMKETVAKCYDTSLPSCSAIEWQKTALYEKTKGHMQGLHSTSTLFTLLGAPLLLSSLGFGAGRKEEDVQPQSKSKAQTKLSTQKN